MKGPCPFRFEAVWASHPTYDAMVSEAWNSLHTVDVNLRTVKERSLVFNKATFGNIFHRKRTLEERLKGLQRELERVDSASLLRTLERVHKELDLTLRQEERLWYQKSREQVTRYGDRNTKYFGA